MSVLRGSAVAFALFVGMMALLEVGRYLGARRAKAEQEPPPGLGAVEGAVFGLLGLVVGLLSDLTYVWVDPRIDFETRET